MFGDDFQVYPDIIYLLFEFEHKLGRELDMDRFSVYLDRERYIEKDKDLKYYIPLQIKIDREKLSFDQYFEILKLIPMFNIKFRSFKSKLLELSIGGLSQCKLDIKIDESLKDRLIEENRKLLGISGGGEVSNELKSLLTHNSIQFEEMGRNIIIRSEKLIITRQPLSLLTDLNEFDVIFEDIKTFYTSINTSLSQKQGAVKSIGYYVKKNGTIIEQNSTHHIAIISDHIYDILG